MPPRNNYSNADMFRMQRDAEERVREMRSRARTATQVGDFPVNPQQRHWTTEPGRSRQLPSQPLRPPRRQQEQPQAPVPVPVMEQAPAPPPDVEPYEPQYTQRAPSHEKAAHIDPPAPPAKSPDGGSTILGDIMGALGHGEDTLLIVGLILILINQKSDTTLLLALAYLLI